MKRQWVGRWEKSATLTKSSPICAPSVCTSWWGRSRNSLRRPSSYMTSSVEGWMVSPRKSRRKSACFSRTKTVTPARARSSPSIMPAGPPPAMQQRTETSPVAMGSSSCPCFLCPEGRHHAGESVPKGTHSVSHRRQRRQTEDMLKGLHFFEARGFPCRNVVTVGGAVGFGDGSLGRDDADRRASRHALGAQEGGNRSLIIGLGHGNSLSE